MQDLTDHVRIQQGTDSVMSFSHGNTLPLVSMPFAMNGWVLETFANPLERSPWFYSPYHRSTAGIRCTHQPSPWCGDYSCFRLFAQTGPADFSLGGLASGFAPEATVMRPELLSVTLSRYGVRLSLAPTTRGALVEAQFPNSGAGRRVLCHLVYGTLEWARHPDGRTVLLSIETPAPGVYDALRFHVAVRSSQPLADVAAYGEPTTQRGIRRGEHRMTVPMGVALELPPDTRAFSAGRTVLLRIATSYISREQALRTLEHEVAAGDVNGAAETARCAWNNRLRRIQVSSRNNETLSTFYSCLYRSQLYPNATHEIDETGATVHRSFYNGAVSPGEMVTNNGFWDTYRTVYPFLSLVFPETLASILRGWVNASREGEWTPKWPAPGHRGTMIGTHLDAVFADAFTKEIDGWNAEEAYHYARKNAFQEPPEGAPYGRVGLGHYLRSGYVPEDQVEHGASRTLDFAYGDYCLAQMARAYGRPGDEETLLERSRWYANIYDPAVGFLRGRRADGSFADGFDPFRWGGPYVEGSAWQCGLAVYHDPLGLAALLAGARPGEQAPQDPANALEARLDALMNAQAAFDSGAYGYEIHEMSEMAAVDFGQYAHSNQPSHHIPFLYTLTRSPWKADHIVRSVLEQLYNSTPRGFCGDEDNGEMACWYLLAALGLYQICPGRPDYTLTAPLFEEVVVEPENGPRLRILAPGNTANARFLDSVTVRGESTVGRSLPYQALRDGGDVVFSVKRVP